MISAKNYNTLPAKSDLQKICKAIAVLDAILSQEWEYRYYSYNSQWAEGEEFFEMRDGQGDQLLILFRNEGCIINGFAHEYYEPDKALLTQNLPAVFREFMFGEPVKTIGTTFCLWTIGAGPWQTGQVGNRPDGSEELLYIFDGLPQTYIEWASEYFEEGYKENGIPLETVTRIYAEEPLTKEMVLSIVDDLEDWGQLQTDLDEIGYSYQF